MTRRALAARGALLLALLPAAASAHAEHCAQSSYVTVGPARVEVAVDVAPGARVAGAFIARVDADRDGALSDAERMAYGRAAVADLSLALDGLPVALRLDEVVMNERAAIETGETTVRLRASAPTPPLAAGPHGLAFINRHRPAESVYTANVFCAPPAVTLSHITRDASQQRLDARFDLAVATSPPRTTPPRRGPATWAVSAALLAFGALVVGSLRRRGG